MKNNSYTGAELNIGANLYHSTPDYSDLTSCTKSSNSNSDLWYYSDASLSNADHFAISHKEKICRAGNAVIQASLIIANNNIILNSVEKPAPLMVI